MRRIENFCKQLDLLQKEVTIGLIPLFISNPLRLIVHTFRIEFITTLTKLRIIFSLFLNKF